MIQQRKSVSASRKIVALLLVGVMSMISLAPGAAQAQPPAPDSSQNVTPMQTATRTYLPLTLKNQCTAAVKMTKNRFGVQTYGYLGVNSPYYCSLVGSGANWVRNDINWDQVEPNNVTPPVYRWTASDRVVETAGRGEFEIIATIIRNPSWAATSPEGVIDKVPLSRFASFVGAVVERYDGDGINDAPGSPRIQYWEFYNEPDAGFIRNDYRWGNHGEEYAEMLAAVYPAVKAADPTAKVLLGGIAYDWFEEQGGPFVRNFIDDVLANDGGDYFDIMNFHQYPTFAPNWGSPNGPGLVEKTAAIRTKLAEYGVQKPIFITESGMHSNDAVGNPMTPELQARYVTMLLAQTLAANVDVHIWWMLFDPGATYPYNNGLVTSVSSNTQEPVRKPSFIAYRTAVAFLEGAVFQRTLSSGETNNADMIAYQFTERNGQTLYVAWLGPIRRMDTADLSLPGTAATVFDIYGAARTVTDGDDGQTDGRITLAVGAQPVYVRIQP